MSRAMTTRLVLAGALALAALALVTTAVGSTRGDGQRRSSAQAKLQDATGRTVGRVKLREGRRGTVRVRVSARGLTAGFHGFHVHEKGLCEAPSQADGKTGSFLSAGGHLRTGSQGHGEHKGDMPSLFATRDGRARAAFETDSFSVRELLDADGSAVMVHANRDNFANIPDRYRSSGEPGPDAETLETGDSGDRVACGVVEAKRR